MNKKISRSFSHSLAAFSHIFVYVKVTLMSLFISVIKRTNENKGKNVCINEIIGLMIILNGCTSYKHKKKDSIFFLLRNLCALLF